ncbi:MFS transporter [Haematobacter massiliensis]|uniref:MFS transporter n=1 Tax=Haematobacter massiliensis TaxID=195105 RepID=A0A086YD17_9RHOB|nr:MFS transporter [Haematobacter massiliensis]KFI32167.1 MFS transporter [Haematobacter massiliensis]OWJ72856.1 MFS transporter [Haematobacter massiliensis]OWJ85864.1 MFS transporter [Haematobacter massiliensis]QBJ24544.1 MFS transporter [Haematobacter massiliensis]
MPERPSSLAPFRHRTFRMLWMATLLSNLGGLIQGVGAGWMMTTLTTSTGLVALVQASTTLPIMLFSIPAGALADTLDRRRIMLFAQSFMLLVSIGLALTAFAGLLTPWTLLAFTFMIGVGTALHNPSWQSSMGDIVPRQDLAQAVSLNSMGFNLMRSVGPAIGGIIVATAGAAMAFALNALSYVSLIFALWRWKPDPKPAPLAREPLGRAIGSGLRYVSMSPHLLKVMLRAFCFGFSAVSILALLPVVSQRLLNGTALTYGLLLGCFGLGAIGGAFSNSRMREVLSNENVARCGFLAVAITTAMLAVSRDLWLSCLFLLLGGAGWVLALSLFNVTVQLSTPRWVVGRALAFYQTFTFGGMAIGSWVWGMIAEEYGVDTSLLAASITLVLGMALGLAWSLPAFGTVNLDPLDRFNEPALRLDIKQRSGPLMIMVDYVIRPEDTDDFLAAMSERRRIRIRDGARQWALLRDLEQPDLWTESYHVPTWMDYLRHNQRRTVGDYEITKRLRMLHSGDAPPRVHRMIERQTVPPHDDLPLKPISESVH